MKNSKPILFSAMIVVLFSIVMIGGCKKEGNTNIPAPCTNGIKDGDETGIDCGGSCNACTGTSARVKTIVGIVNPFYDSIAYDNTGRQILYDGQYRTEEYIYSGNTVTKRVYNLTGGGFDFSGTITYSLNASNLATTSVSRNNNGTTNYFAYTYDPQQNLTLQTSIDSTGFVRDTIINTWLNGNLNTFYEGHADDNNLIYYSYSTEYTYLTSKINTIGNENMGIAFLGKSSKNILKTYTDGSNIISLTYTYDANGRVAWRGGPLYTYY